MLRRPISHIARRRSTNGNGFGGGNRNQLQALDRGRALLSCRNKVVPWGLARDRDASMIPYMYLRGLSAEVRFLR